MINMYADKNLKKNMHHFHSFFPVIYRYHVSMTCMVSYRVPRRSPNNKGLVQIRSV